MDILYTIESMRRNAGAARRAGRPTALVPTMGCLHEGHLSLMRRARAAAERVVVSIFVNPTQFGPQEDFARYPRQLEQDLALCAGEGVEAVFCPRADEIYAPDHSVYVEEARLTRGLCGQARPGHFRGVATVVAKLFNIVGPDVAVFGQKDAQQAQLIRRMVRDLNLPVEIVVAPIVREPDGLAMSSRNRYLSPDDRRQAVCLYQALQAAERLYGAGERDAGRLREAMRREIAASAGAAIEYIEIVDAENFESVAELRGACVAALCVRFGSTRLIDNARLGP